MKEASSPNDQIYYFSAVYGALQRVLNIEYDQRIGLVHFVCLYAHNAVLQRLIAVMAGQEMNIKLSNTLFTTLADLTGELAKRIQNDEDVIDILEKFSEIAYTMSGNGYYLASTGRIPS